MKVLYFHQEIKARGSQVQATIGYVVSSGLAWDTGDPVLRRKMSILFLYSDNPWRLRAGPALLLRGSQDWTQSCQGHASLSKGGLVTTARLVDLSFKVVMCQTGKIEIKPRVGQGKKACWLYLTGQVEAFSSNLLLEQWTDCLKTQQQTRRSCYSPGLVQNDNYEIWYIKSWQ